MHQVGAGWTAVERKLGINLYRYNYAEVHNPYNLQANEARQYPKEIQTLPPKERDQLLVRKALQFISTDIVRYATHCARRFFYLVSPVTNFHRVDWKWNALLFVSTLLFFYSLWAGVFYSWFRRYSFTESEWLLFSLIVIWYVFHIFVHASIRQRLPADIWLAALVFSIYSRVFFARTKERSPATT